MKQNKDEKTHREQRTKKELLSEQIRSVKNDTVNYTDFVRKNGTTLPKNLPPVFVVNENLSNYYAAIHKENVSKTFSLNETAKMNLIYQNGKLTNTPLFAINDVKNLIDTSVDAVTDKKMKHYESIAKALRANESLDINNMRAIVSNVITSGRHIEGLNGTRDKVTSVIAKNLDRDSMDEHIDKSFNDFIWEMRRQSDSDVSVKREEIQSLRNSVIDYESQIKTLEQQVGSSPNKAAINKVINSTKEKRKLAFQKVSRLEKEVGAIFDNETSGRIQGHLENLSSNEPVVTDELVNDYYKYLSKRDSSTMSYLNSMSDAYDNSDGIEEIAITEMLNDANVMNKESHEVNPLSKDTYEKLRKDISSEMTSVNGELSEEVLEEMVKGTSSIKLQKLKASQKNEALNMIEDNTLRDFVDAAYVEYSEDGDIIHKPLSYISTVGTTYQSPDGNYSVMIKGIDDIENLSPDSITDYLKYEDAYADIDIRYKESMKLGKGLYADSLLAKIKHFKEFQENKDTAAIRSQFDAVAFHGTKELAPDFITPPSRESITLNPRVKSMIPQELAEAMPNSVAVKKDILDSIERDKNVFDIMESVIKPLSTQRSDQSLRLEAEETVIAFDLFKQVRVANGLNEKGSKNLDDMNNLILSSYSGKYSAAGAEGDIARMYEKALESLDIDKTTPFANLDEHSQLTVMDEIENKMVSKLSNRIDNIEYGLREKSYNRELQKERDRVNEQKSIVNSEIIEIENFYNGGLTKDVDGDLEAAKTSLWENDYETRTKIEAEREAMKSQRLSIAENLDNASSSVDKKDYEGIIAYTQSTSEIRRVRDIGRLSSHTNYLTYEELMDGLVKDGDEYIPVEQFKQYHTMMDATQLMRSKPTGEFNNLEKYKFSPEEWKRGSVIIGNSEIPITQFSEYYDRDVRVDRVTWLRNNNPQLIGDTRVHSEYKDHSVPQDIATIEKSALTPTEKLNKKKFMPLGKWASSKEALSVSKDSSTMKEYPHNPIQSFSMDEILERHSNIPGETAEAMYERSVKKALKEIAPKNDSAVRKPINRYIKLEDKANRGVYLDSDSYRRKSVDDVGSSVAYTQEDYHNIHKLSVLENTLSSDDARIVVEKPIDRKLIENLNNWREGGTSVILKNSNISKEIVGVDGNTVALRNRSALIEDTKIKMKYNGEGTLFEALMKFDEIIGSTGDNVRNGRELVDSISGVNENLASEVSHKQAAGDMTRNRMGDIISTIDVDGKEVSITRKQLFDKIKKDAVSLGSDDWKHKGDSIPRLIHDTAMINFSWMGIAGENVNDLMGAGAASLDRAMNSVSDEKILEAFAKNGVSLSDWHTIDQKKAHSVMMDAFGHRAKLEMLFEYLGEDGSPSGDAADTAIRVARKANETHGISNTADNIYSALFAMKKGMGKLDDETKQYFSVIDKLIANDYSLLQKVLESPQEVLTDFTELVAKNETDFTEFETNSTEIEQDKFKKDIQEIFDLKAPQEELSETNVNLNMAPDALDKKIKEAAESSDYYISKMEKYTKHKGDIRLRVANAPSFDYKSNQKLNNLEAMKLMSEVLEQFESEDIGKDLKEILNRNVINPKTKEVRGTVKDLIIKNTLSSFSDQKMTLYGMNKKLEATLDRYMSKGIYSNAVKKVNKVEMLRKLNDEIPGSAVNYIKANGGTVSAFGELGIVPKGNAGAVGNMKVVQEALENMKFGSLEDAANFSLIQELIPGVSLSVETKDSSGNIINGTLGNHRTYDGLIDPVVTTTSGEKVKLVHSRDESLQLVKLNGLDAKDFRVANENVATKHMSKSIEDGATHYNMVAGFSGNYSVMSRRPYGTGGVDPMTMIKNMSDFISDKKQTGLVFDFETTGLPDKLRDGLFAPIEFSYLAYDKKYRTGRELDFDSNASRVVTKYAKPNKDVKKFFGEAMEDNSYVDLFRTEKMNVGKDNSAFMLLKNYAKYDNTEVSFNGKNYTWGSILTSEMSIDNNNLGKVIAHIGDEEIHMNLSVAQVVNQIKQSGQDVFDYLSSGGARGADARFGIDGKDIKTEKELVKTAVKKMNSYNKLIGHNISTADLKWLRRWANRLGIDGVSDDIETRAIDTQDILQAAQPGRKSNKLSDHTNDIASAHLAYADIKTNIGLFNKLTGDNTINTLMGEVEQGISKNDYIVKIANQKLGMSQIPKGRYQLGGIEMASDGIGGVLSLINMSTMKAEEYPADNIAVIKKELADNWVNFGTDGVAAYNHSNVQSVDDASKTLYNAFGKPAVVDRYIQYGKSDFEVSRAVLEDMHNSIYNAELKASSDSKSYGKNALESSINLLGLSHKTTEEVAEGVFESRTVSDIERLVISNSSKLTGKKYLEQLTYLADNASTRKEEFRHVAEYFDTDEGKLAKKYLKQIHYREQAGIITKDQRRIAGDTLYQRVMDVKREAIASNKINGFEQTIEGKFTVGTLTKTEVSKYRGILGDKTIEVFKDKELILDLRNAEQTRRSIFSMSDDLAAQIHYRSKEAIPMEEARAKVVNETILPMLKKYSINKDLQAAITAHGTADANPDYMHAVNSLATELSSRKAELVSDGGMLHGKEYKALIATKGINASTHPELFNDIKSSMEATLDELDIKSSSSKQSVDGKLIDVPIPGGVEKIREIASVIEANEETALREISQLESYKKAVANGYDPIANGVNPLPMLDYSHNNSGGIAKLNTIDKVSEWRFTDNPERKWMTYRTADELLDIANGLQTQSDAYEIPKIIEALRNEKIKPEDAKYYKDNFKGAISFIESKIKHPISDIAGIERLNQATVQRISNQYAEMRKNDTSGNAFNKSSIMRELMTRASMKVDSPVLENGLITQDMVKKNPTKYNAMKALGLMQPTSDGKAYYTGAIGSMDNFNNVYSANGPSMSLDPRKVLLLGNEEMNIGGTRISSNELAGVPITHLTKEQISHVANDKYANKRYKAYMESYLDKVKDSERYNQDASARYKKHVAKVKTMNQSPSQDIITGLNKRVVSENSNKNAAKQTANDAINGHPNVKGVDPSKVIEQIKRITDSPLYNGFVDTMEDAKAQAKKMLRGIEGSNMVKFGAIGLGVGVGMKLIGNYSSSGRRPEENPNGGAPRVDGTYDKSYNNGSRPTIGSKTVRLEENGRGLNISAKAQNRNNTSDEELNNMLSGMLGTSFGSNVNIKYQDDRSVIDNSYVQNLVSNALFG